MSNIIADLAAGVRKLQKINKALSDLEFQEQIVGQKTLLVAAQSELLDQKKEIETLNQRYKELEDHLSFRGQLVDVKGFKYDIDVSGNPIGMPYCPVCEKKSRLFINIIAYGYHHQDNRCPSCRTEFGISVKRLGPR